MRNTSIESLKNKLSCERYKHFDRGKSGSKIKEKHYNSGKNFRLSLLLESGLMLRKMLLEIKR